MKNKNERGQSLVELGISLLILMYLLSGAVEFGMAFFQFVQLRDAAQEGALYGSMNPSDIVAIRNRVVGASSSPINLSGGTVTIAVEIDGIDSSNAAYNTVDCEGHGLTVRVSYPHQVFMPFIPQLIGRSTIPLTATVTDTILSPLQCTP